MSNENNSPLASGGPWDCEAHQGTITDVSAGSNRKVIILGKDSSGNVLYRGEVTGVTVTAGQTTSAGTILADVFNPTLLAPEDGSTVTNGAFSLEWNPIAGVSEYQIQISANSTFPTTTIDTTTTSPIYAPSELSYGTTFFWRVRAKDGYGNQSIWSEVWAFTVSTEPGIAPSAPTNVNATAASGGGYGAIIIAWDPVSGATSYSIYSAYSSGVSKTNYEEKIADITTTSYNVPGLNFGTTYYLIVTAQNDYGESDESSEVNATPSVTVKIPFADTGQTQSYTDTFGEDSDYTINPPSYTKLDGEGNELSDTATDWVVVKDNVTGLIWEVKTDDGSVHDMHNSYDWQDAQDLFIAELNGQRFGGYSDWRIPTVMELSSIVNSGTYDPAVNTDYFANTMSSDY